MFPSLGNGSKLTQAVFSIVCGGTVTIINDYESLQNVVFFNVIGLILLVVCLLTLALPHRV